MPKERAVVRGGNSAGCPSKKEGWPGECDGTKHLCFGCGRWVCGAHLDLFKKKCPDCYKQLGFSIRTFTPS